MRLWISILMLLVLSSCGGDEGVSIPKPRLYPKVNYPTKAYQTSEEVDCPFRFRYPTYADIEKEKYFDDVPPVHPCWFDIVMDTLNARIHCSYIPIDDRKHFDKLVNDAFRMVNEHNPKASGRQDSIFRNKYGAEGLIYNINGDVASPIQFFVTDSTTHFLRASLYFNAHPNGDSLAPIVRYLKKDVDTLISSFEWE